MSATKHLIVIGGGAAGFFCAVNAARLNTGLKVTILEKSGKLLSKVKVSGGGRCNVTHACFDIDEMSKKYPRGTVFIKKTFHQFFTNDTIQWFEERGVKLKQEKDGRMFPVSDSSQSIIDCLFREANRYKVDIIMNSEVQVVEKKDELFALQLANGKKYAADFVCIACGGYPKTAMFNWLIHTGHSIEPPVPSLFTFNMPNHPITKLMGIAVENTVIKVTGTKLVNQGPLLITHWGFSGPGILKLSAMGARIFSACNYQFSISVNWLPAYTEQEMITYFSQLRFELATQKIYSKNPFGLPQRLWEFLLSTTSIDSSKKWADVPAKEMNKLAKIITASEFNVNGKTTFKEEFVTAGGIKLNEIDYNSMMSKIVPNLFFAGEIVDIDGVTGGFNFQHAWTSGFIAADKIASKAG